MDEENIKMQNFNTQIWENINMMSLFLDLPLPKKQNIKKEGKFVEEDTFKNSTFNLNDTVSKPIALPYIGMFFCRMCMIVICILCLLKCCIFREYNS